MESVVAFVQALPKGATTDKKRLEAELGNMGAQIAGQKRKGTLTHIVLVSSPSLSPLPEAARETEMEEIRRAIDFVGQVMCFRAPTPHQCCQ